jgi:hypothetical protein
MVIKLMRPMTDMQYRFPEPTIMRLKLFVTITGDTGKYANASGYFLIYGIQPMPEGAASCTFDGVIDF